MYDGLLLTRKNSIFHMLRYCIFIGFVSGYAASAYTLFVEYASHYSQMLYSLINENKWYILLIMAVLCAGFFICTYIVRLSNVSRGSGVPQAMGLLRGAFIMKWVRGLIVMLTCSIVGTLCGLSLGSEGPAMIIGGLAAMGASKLLPMYTRDYMVTGGVGSGLSVAFNAPLSGVFIVLEEGHKRLSPVIFFNTAVIVLVATVTSYCILGYRVVIPVHDFAMSFIDLPFLLILGIVVGLCGICFNAILLYLRKLFKHLKFKKVDLRYLPPFVLALIIGIFLLPANGGGLPLIKSLLADNFVMGMLWALLVTKLMYTIVCTSTGVPGGIFVPMLAVGALVGAIFAKFIGMHFAINIELYIVSAMVAYFTAVSHGYITALILAFELTRNPLYIIPAFLVCSMTRLVIVFAKAEGLYDTLLDKTIKENTKKLDDVEIFQSIIEANSFADGRMISDLILPAGVRLIGCNGKDLSMCNTGLALRSYDILKFELHSLDNPYSKSVILSLLTSKNKDDDLDGTPPNITL